MWRLAIIGSLGACTFNGSVAQIDGSPETDSGPLADAQPPDASVVELGPWTVPTPLASFEAVGVNARYDDPFVVGDRIYWSIDPVGMSDDEDIFVADFDIETGTATNVNVVGELERGAGENVPWVNQQDTEMLFAAFANGRLDLFVSRRSSNEVVWGPPSATEFSTINEILTDEAPGHLTGNELIYSVSGGGESDIFIATRPSAGQPFAAGAPLQNLSSPALNEYGARLSNNGLRIAYHAKPANSINDEMDIFISERATVSEAFPVGVAVSELNSQVEDSDLWISDDGRTALFSSNRSGRFRIYISRRSPLN